MKSLLFKVEIDNWSAELQLSAVSSLNQLAYAVIDAVGFDMDHAYGFYDNFKDPYRSKEEYTLFADLGEDARPGDSGVNTTSIHSVFKPGKKMIFLFDYGDDWCFLVTCTSEANVRAFKRPKLLAASGVPPEQYPDYDEE